jgi:hypothetical protein
MHKVGCLKKHQYLTQKEFEKKINCLGIWSYCLLNADSLNLTSQAFDERVPDQE